MQDQNSRSSRSVSPIHLSTEQKTAFVNNYSNVRVVRSITRFDGAHLSYALVRSNCNKLVITWPLGCLANLVNQPAPSWPCYNYYIQLVHVSLSSWHNAILGTQLGKVCYYSITHSSACSSHSSHVSPALDWLPALPLQVWLTGFDQDGPPSSPS